MARGTSQSHTALAPSRAAFGERAIAPGELRLRAHAAPFEASGASGLLPSRS